MADTDDPADAAARLEKALERIAALAALPVRPHPREAAEAAIVAQRLDRLIAKLRTALAGRPG